MNFLKSKFQKAFTLIEIIIVLLIISIVLSMTASFLPKIIETFKLKKAVSYVEDNIDYLKSVASREGVLSRDNLPNYLAHKKDVWGHPFYYKTADNLEDQSVCVAPHTNLYVCLINNFDAYKNEIEKYNPNRGILFSCNESDGILIESAAVILSSGKNGNIQTPILDLDPTECPTEEPCYVVPILKNIPPTQKVDYYLKVNSNYTIKNPEEEWILATNSSKYANNDINSPMEYDDIVSYLPLDVAKANCPSRSVSGSIERFWAEPIDPDINENVAFHWIATLSGVGIDLEKISCAIDFGDGNITSWIGYKNCLGYQTKYHSYNESGVYTPILKIYDDEGNLVLSKVTNVYVKSSSGACNVNTFKADLLDNGTFTPLADASTSDAYANVTVPATIRFSWNIDFSTCPADKEKSCFITFGDGTTQTIPDCSSINQTVHTYSYTGDYIARLFVNCGCESNKIYLSVKYPISVGNITVNGTSSGGTFTFDPPPVIEEFKVSALHVTPGSQIKISYKVTDINDTVTAYVSVDGNKICQTTGNPAQVTDCTYTIEDPGIHSVYLIAHDTHYNYVQRLILVDALTSTLGTSSTPQVIYASWTPPSGQVVAIKIYNPNNYTLTNYQVKINAQSIADCIGLKFKIVTSDGTKEIPYCFERENGECGATFCDPNNYNCTDEYDTSFWTGNIWIKVPEIPANGSVLLVAYPDIYYHAVDGKEVFDLYDDFNNGNIDNSTWIGFKNGEFVNITDILSYTHFDNGYLYFSGFLPVGICTKNDLTLPFVIGTHLNMTNNRNTYLFYGVSNNVSQGAEFYQLSGHNYLYTGLFRFGSSFSGISTSKDTTTYYDDIYKINIYATGNSNAYIYFKEINKKYPIYYDENYKDEYYTSGKLCFLTTQTTSKMDYIYIRKYASQEPTYTLTCYTSQSWSAPPPPEIEGCSKRVIVSNLGDCDLEDYQIEVDLKSLNLTSCLIDPNNNSKLSFEICLDDNCTQTLPYCFETANGECKSEPEDWSNVRYIWVKVPYIKANDYVYLTFKQVSEDSFKNNVDGDQVFDFYDDFTNDLSKWNIHRATGDTANECYLDNKTGLLYLTTNVATKGCVAYPNIRVKNGFIAEFRYKMGGGSGADGMGFEYNLDKYVEAGTGGSLGITLGSLSTGYIVELDTYDNGVNDPSDENNRPIEGYIGIANLTDWDGGYKPLAYQFISDIRDNNFHTVEVDVDINNKTTVYFDGKLFESLADISTPLENDIIAVSGATGGLTDYHILDWFRIRKKACGPVLVGAAPNNAKINLYYPPCTENTTSFVLINTRDIGFDNFKLCYDENNNGKCDYNENIIDFCYLNTDGTCTAFKTNKWTGYIYAKVNSNEKNLVAEFDPNALGVDGSEWFKIGSAIIEGYKKALVTKVTNNGNVAYSNYQLKITISKEYANYLSGGTNYFKYFKLSKYAIDPQNIEKTGDLLEDNLPYCFEQPNGECTNKPAIYTVVDGSKVFDFYYDFDNDDLDNIWEIYGNSPGKVDFPEDGWVRLYPVNQYSGIGIKHYFTDEDVVVHLRYNYVAGSTGEPIYLDIDGNKISLPKTNYPTDSSTGTQIHNYTSQVLNINNYVGLYGSRQGWDLDVRFDYIYITKDNSSISTSGQISFDDSSSLVIHNSGDEKRNIQLRITLPSVPNEDLYLVEDMDNDYTNGYIAPVYYCYEQPNGECKAYPRTNVIWIKLPYLPSNEDVYVYNVPDLKYRQIANDITIWTKTDINSNGNFYVAIIPIVNDEDPNIVDGSDIFELYDDFTESDLDSNLWTIDDLDSDYTLENGILHYKSGGTFKRTTLYSKEDFSGYLGYKVDILHKVYYIGYNGYGFGFVNSLDDTSGLPLVKEWVDKNYGVRLQDTQVLNTPFEDFKLTQFEYYNGTYNLLFNNKLVTSLTSDINKYFFIGNPVYDTTAPDWSGMDIDYVKIYKFSPKISISNLQYEYIPTKIDAWYPIKIDVSSLKNKQFTLAMDGVSQTIKYCFFHPETLECNKASSDYIYTKLPMEIEPKDKKELIFVKANDPSNSLTTGKDIFALYEDFTPLNSWNGDNYDIPPQIGKLIIKADGYAYTNIIPGAGYYSISLKVDYINNNTLKVYCGGNLINIIKNSGIYSFKAYCPTGIFELAGSNPDDPNSEIIIDTLLIRRVDEGDLSFVASSYQTFSSPITPVIEIQGLTHSIWTKVYNPNDKTLVDYQFPIDNIGWIKAHLGLGVNGTFYLRDENENFINYCFEQDNGECNLTPTDKRIWVKMTLSAASSKWIKFVANNYNIKPAGLVNGDKIFDFYDDFNNSTLDTNKWIITTNAYKIENGILDYYPKSDNFYLMSIKQFTNNFTLEERINLNYGSSTEVFAGVQGKNTYDDKVGIFGDSSSAVSYIFTSDFSTNKYTSYYLGLNNPTNFVNIKLSFDTTNKKVRAYLNNILKFEAPIDMHYGYYHINNYGYQYQLDWIRIRKYVPNTVDPYLSSELISNPTEGYDVTCKAYKLSYTGNDILNNYEIYNNDTSFITNNALYLPITFEGKYIPYCEENAANGECKENINSLYKIALWLKYPQILPNSKDYLPDGIATSNKFIIYKINSANGYKKYSLDGKNIFLFYDDFDDQDISDWNTYDMTATIDKVAYNTYVKLSPGTATYYKHMFYHLISNLPSRYIIESMMYDYNCAGGPIYIFQDENNWMSFEHYVSYGHSIPRGYYQGQDVGWLDTSLPLNFKNNEWMKVSELVNKEDVVESTKYGKITYETNYGFNQNGIGFVEHKGFGPMEIDWIRVRQYADIQPILLDINSNTKVSCLDWLLRGYYEIYCTKTPYEGIFNCPIDPDGDYGELPTFNATCDMKTDGGGWTLVLNYLHKGNTNPDLSILTDRLPIIGNTTLGIDESGTIHWGHAGNSLMFKLDKVSQGEFRFFCKTSHHTRIMDFISEIPTVENYFTTGTFHINIDNFKTYFIPLPDHSAYLPSAANNYYANQGDLATTNFPFWLSGTYHWGIRGNAYRWECDDYPNNYVYDTYHQIWLR